MCKSASERASGSGEQRKKQPEAAQFDSFESFMCDVTIGVEQQEVMIVEVDLAGEADQQ